jgi:hypothetical protein
MGIFGSLVVFLGYARYVSTYSLLSSLASC